MNHREKYLLDTQTLFGRDVCQRATKPLRDGVEILISVDASSPFTLVRKAKDTVIEDRVAIKPDMRLDVPPKALQQCLDLKTEEIGELGVEILKLMAHSDPDFRIRVKLHVGLFDFLLNGYLGILPLGGPTVMKFLASRGLTGIGKIKEAIARLRT